MIRWGTRSAEFPMPDGRVAVCTYKFFALLWIFPWARSQQWHIASPEGTTPVDYDEIVTAFAPVEAPQLSLFRR